MKRSFRRLLLLGSAFLLPITLILNFFVYQKSQEEQYIQAIEILEELLRTQSEYLPTYYKTGQLQELVGNNERAIELYLEGKKLARIQKDFKTEGELSEALMLLDVFDE
jgi:tetratricopeptide (TPR) repeat protein